MAHRSFAITLPNDTNYHNLFSLIVGSSVYGSAQGGTQETGVTGAIPTDGILPDRVRDLKLSADQGNVASTILVGDRNHTNTDGIPLFGGDFLQRDSFRNTICLKDYFIKQSAGALKMAIDLEFA